MRPIFPVVFGSTTTVALAGLLGLAVLAGGCGKKKFEVTDVDPGQAGVVRSTGPESQDVLRVSDLMVRSLSADPAITQSPNPPTIVMLPMENNTRFPFNKGVFSTRLKAQLNKDAKGMMRFVSRDILDDIVTERDAKRAGDVDYDPTRRTAATAGGDFFLKGYAEGLSNTSSKGTSDYILYTFKLVDAESGIEVWQDLFEVKREGADDVLYR